MIWQSCTFSLTQASDNPTRGSEIADPMMLKSSSNFPDSRRTLTTFSRCGQWPCQHSLLCLNKTGTCSAQVRSVQSTEQCGSLALLFPMIAQSRPILAMLPCQYRSVFSYEPPCMASSNTP